MKKFYIASSFQNIDMVREVSDILRQQGYVQTYDWTQNERAATLKELKRIGELEKEAVIEADFVIVLLPAGKGSHIEFGIALGHNKRIYLYSTNDDVNNPETTSTFYHLDNVVKVIGTVDDLIEKLR
ncbi:group-specific protein [Sutcliffiella rhizosphaerae]|uniref:Group-specific protein n=1 Tax=Sutcliffiella rhizosphaerae TaxID=2880967 RepID=A0ABM8YRJ8_9BACI|nr:group-specific protein [Sutcliffiella rhizosphaerae]CAG9622490.1 hypothetical protein BACCIP111883_03281 [Sutcliffiella rhizosphaerae]